LERREAGGVEGEIAAAMDGREVKGRSEIARKRAPATMEMVRLEALDFVRASSDMASFLSFLLLGRLDMSLLSIEWVCGG
jgi:hypothetical protein